MTPDEAAQIILAGTTAALAERVPERAFISPGREIVWENCDQLTVVLRSLKPSERFPAGSEISNWGFVPVADFLVEVTRCIPVSEQPIEPALLEKPALELMRDAYSLLTWIPDLPGCTFYNFGPVETVGPQGGRAAVRLSISLALG